MFKPTQKNCVWESEPTLIFLAKGINIQLVRSEFQLSSQNEVNQHGWQLQLLITHYLKRAQFSLLAIKGCFK